MTQQGFLLLHFFGVFLVVGSLGATTLLTLTTGSKNFKQRRMLSLGHGIGLLIVLIAGLGLMAKLGIHGAPPPWIMMKLGIWLILGILPAFIYRMPRLGKIWWGLVVLLATYAAFLGVFKP